MHMGHGLEHRTTSHLFILRTVLPESNEQSCVLCVSCLLPHQCNWLHGYAIPAISEAEFMRELDPYITIAIAAEKWCAWYLIRKAMLNSCPWCYNRLQGKVTWSCNSYGNWAITPTMDPNSRLNSISQLTLPDHIVRNLRISDIYFFSRWHSTGLPMNWYQGQSSVFVVSPVALSWIKQSLYSISDSTEWTRRPRPSKKLHLAYS